jgi:putative peptidoglycan lipid II flippase
VSESRSLLRNSGVMAAGTVVSRLTGMVRNSMIAAAIGTALLSDTYLVANTVPNILYILLVGGALNAVFIPQLVRHLREDDDGGDAFAQRLITVVGVVLLGVSAVAVLAAPLIVRLYSSARWTSEELGLSVAFARFCLPQIFFYGLATMLGQVLNSRGRFAAPMWTPILNNLVVIVVALLFIRVSGTDPSVRTITAGQTTLLGVGTTAGIAVQALALVPSLRAVGFRLRPRFDLRGAGLGRSWVLAKWTLVFVATNQVSYAIITKLATTTGSLAKEQGLDFGAGYSPYSYAHLLFLLPHAVVTVSVVTALFPRISGAAAAGDVRAVGRSVSEALRLIMVVIVPAAAAMLVLGPRIGVTLFGYGHAGARSGSFVGETLQAFALGLVPFTVYYVLLRAYYALEDTRTPAFLNVVLNLANLGLALALFAALPVRYKVPGLALAYALAYVVAALLTWFAAQRRLGALDAYEVVRLLVRVTLAALLGALVALLVATVLGAAVGTSPLATVLGLLLATAAGGVTYVALAHLLHIAELRSFVATVRRRRSG